MSGKTFIQRKPPNDGRQYDCQCARCGSTLSFEDCWECGGDGYVADDVDGFDGDDVVPCNVCAGEAAFPVCISTEEWCKAHPIQGREDIERATPEWFEWL